MFRKRTVKCAVAVVSCLMAWRIASAQQAATPFPVTINVDAAKSLGEMKPIWRMFGADEPNYAYVKDGKRLIGELGQMRPDDVFFRAHNLLSTGDGTPAYKWGSTNIYTEDKDGKPVYDWTIVDRIIDTYRARGVHPYLELGFMPEAMSTNPQPYQHEWRPGSGKLDTGLGLPAKGLQEVRRIDLPVGETLH